MAVKAATDTLAVVLKKNLSTSNVRTAVEVRLVSGDVHEVQWAASSSSKWLVLEQSSGTVSSLNPVVAINVLVIGSGQNDTAVRPMTHTMQARARACTRTHARHTTTTLSFLGYLAGLRPAAFVDRSE